MLQSGRGMKALKISEGTGMSMHGEAVRGVTFTEQSLICGNSETRTTGKIKDVSCGVYGRWFWRETMVLEGEQES